MWSSITGCLGPIVGAWACNRYPLLALSICPSLLFFAQAVMFATGPETLPVAERKPFSPGSANAFGSLRLLFANGVGLRCEEKPEGIFSLTHWRVFPRAQAVDDCQRHFPRLYLELGHS